MMHRGVQIRLAAFVALAVVGMSYVGASYLGVVDAILGRGATVTVSLPYTGGVYVGSEVDYRGVQVGKVQDIVVTRAGADVIVALDEEARVPRSSRVEVASVSAVGEQYLNFVPESSAGPYFGDGDRVSAPASALPPSTDDLLANIDSFTRSIDAEDLNTVVTELGDLFHGNAENLRIIIDSGTQFVDQATQHQDATIKLLESGGSVLETQQDHSDDIRDFADGLAEVTEALNDSDDDVQDLLEDGPGAITEVDALVSDLRRVLPPFLLPLIELNQVINPRLDGIGQVLAILPIVVKNGLFFGTPGDGYGHISMLFDYTTPACAKGYLPPSMWPSPLDLREHPLYRVKCSDPRAQPGYDGADAIMQRGVNMAPTIDDSKPLYQVKPYGRSTPKDPDGVPAVPGSGGAASATSSADAKVPSGLRSIVGQDGWEDMFVGGAGD